MDRPDSTADIGSGVGNDRELAAAMLQFYRDVQLSLTEMANSLAKWILASLLAINGAAGIAIWQAELPVPFRVLASVAFVLGISSALICAFLQIRSLRKPAVLLGKAIGYWSTVRAGGNRFSESEDTGELATSLNKPGAWIMVLGWLSGLSFILGFAVANFGILSDDKMERVESITADTTQVESKSDSTKSEGEPPSS